MADPNHEPDAKMQSMKPIMTKQAKVIIRHEPPAAEPAAEPFVEQLPILRVPDIEAFLTNRALDDNDVSVYDSLPEEKRLEIIPLVGDLRSLYRMLPEDVRRKLFHASASIISQSQGGRHADQHGEPEQLMTKQKLEEVYETCKSHASTLKIIGEKSADLMQRMGLNLQLAQNQQGNLIVQNVVQLNENADVVNIDRVQNNAGDLFLNDENDVQINDDAQNDVDAQDMTID